MFWSSIPVAEQIGHNPQKLSRGELWNGGEGPLHPPSLLHPAPSLQSFQQPSIKQARRAEQQPWGLLSEEASAVGERYQRSLTILHLFFPDEL